jgi:hypothetical protein
MTNIFMIVTILIILTKLFTWMVFGFPQSERELDYEGRGLIPGKGKHMSSTSRVALVPTKPVDTDGSFSGNTVARTQSRLLSCS